MISNLFKLIKMKKNWPRNSIFGFKILNSFYSILWAYIFLIYQLIITPYFGIDIYEFIAGALFVILINISIIILTINSIIRINKINTLFLLFDFPLFVYIPYSVKKILLLVSDLRMIIN